MYILKYTAITFVCMIFIQRIVKMNKTEDDELETAIERTISEELHCSLYIQRLYFYKFM